MVSDPLSNHQSLGKICITQPIRNISITISLYTKTQDVEKAAVPLARPQVGSVDIGVACANIPIFKKVASSLVYTEIEIGAFRKGCTLELVLKKHNFHAVLVKPG